MSSTCLPDGGIGNTRGGTSRTSLERAPVGVLRGEHAANCGPGGGQCAGGGESSMPRALGGKRGHAEAVNGVDGCAAEEPRRAAVTRNDHTLSKVARAEQASDQPFTRRRGSLRERSEKRVWIS
jgi:hypothetical protein